MILITKVCLHGVQASSYEDVQLSRHAEGSLRIPWRMQRAGRRHLTESAQHGLQGGGPEVTYEDQQRINVYNRTL